jgi:prophage tail gpP-like protein
VPENKRIPKEKGKTLEDAVSIFINGAKAFNGWKAIRIQKNLDSIAQTFSMPIDDRFFDTAEPFPLKSGVEASVFIGSARVITGYIEITDIGFGPGQRNFTLTGRSKSADLVDCSIEGDAEYNNIALDALAKELVAPFGLKVFLSVEPKVLEKFAVKPGESVFDALNRAARTQGFMWVSTRAGNIRLTQAAKFRAVSELHEDFNMKTGRATFDDSKRFSKYIVRGQRQGTDTFNGLNASEPEGIAEDKGISRNRPLIVIADSSVDSEQAKTRAGWEASVRIAQAAQISVTVEGWRQKDGSLWGLNQITRVKSKTLKINRDLLINSVEHIKNLNGGTITNMTLVRPDAYNSKPEFKAKDDPLSDLGL